MSRECDKTLHYKETPHTYSSPPCRLAPKKSLRISSDGQISDRSQSENSWNLKYSNIQMFNRTAKSQSFKDYDQISNLNSKKLGVLARCRIAGKYTAVSKSWSKLIFSKYVHLFDTQAEK